MAGIQEALSGAFSSSGGGANFTSDPALQKIIEFFSKISEALLNDPEGFINQLSQQTTAPDPAQFTAQGGKNIQKLLTPGQGQPGTPGGLGRESIVAPQPKPEEPAADSTLAEKLAAIGKSIQVPESETIPPQAPPSATAVARPQAFNPGTAPQDLLNSLLLADALSSQGGIPSLGALLRQGTPGSGAF